ncbi:tetratricopeptide repeat protein [Synechococcus sp. PCC 7336]|uniref:tetratricopeptide repeat protein n=1 Tax=Synechococcus sp. PCC 7336 TaxID=195250 RepID=UPI00034496BC|nr:tetratricopeptide repeat protein [Synechococcus sp. PCC 7336]
MRAWGLAVLAGLAVAAPAAAQVPEGPICQVDREFGLRCQPLRRPSRLQERSTYSATLSSDRDRLLDIGRQRFDAGDIQGAIAFYTQAIDRDSRSAEAFALRATAYLSSDNPQQAVRDYSQAIAVGTGDPLTDAANYVGRSFAHSRLGQAREAIADATQAISLHPSFAAAYALRGNARISLQDSSGACADWQQAAHLYWQRQEFDRYSGTLTQIRSVPCR